MNSTCPDQETLRQFNEGRIGNPVEVDQITEHLGNCNRCVDQLEKMEPGTIAQGLRNSLAGQEVSNQFKHEDFEAESLSISFQAAVKKIDESLSLSTRASNPAKFGENRYQVLLSVGKGEFGVVFVARPDDSSELVAIKIPDGKQLTSPFHSRQFFEDCRLAGSLKHKNILPILDSGHWDESRVFYSMPLIENPTLKAFAKRKPTISLSQMVAIFSQIADAVEHAHQQNVFHRHLDPENIFVVSPTESVPDTPCDSDFGIVVADFGFNCDSRYQLDLIEPSETDSPFQAPESERNDSAFIDRRTDIYSLGKILKLLLRIIKPPGVFTASQLSEIVSKSTEPRRRNRYQSVKGLKAALEAIDLSDSR